MIIKTNLRLELGLDEIKNDIQKSRLKQFGHTMQMGEKRIPKKSLHKKMRGYDQEEDPQPGG